MTPRNRSLFNFSASYSGGGLKRLYEYAKWFDGAGGAWFVIHPNCAQLLTEFPHNRYFVVKPSRLRRLLDDGSYLHGIVGEIGQPDLYYAYGIPMYRRCGRINWFHLSNVLPLAPDGMQLSLLERLKFRSLRRRIRRGWANSAVISAESAYSLGLIGGLDGSSRPKAFLSVNGSDDELAYIAGRSGRSAAGEEPAVSSRGALATVVGTQGYKALHDSYRVFEMLRAGCAGLTLKVIGRIDWVPPDLRNAPGVVLAGVLKRPDVISCLRATRYYISTTRIENSYNAAAEGIFIADDSYISDIGPHRELLQGSPFEEVAIPGMDRRLLHVRRDELSGANLKSWDRVVVGMIARFQEALNRNEHERQ